MNRRPIGWIAPLALSVAMTLGACSPDQSEPAPPTIAPPMVEGPFRYADVVHQRTVIGELPTGESWFAEVRQEVETWVPREVDEGYAVAKEATKVSRDDLEVHLDPAYEGPFIWWEPDVRVRDLPRSTSELGAELEAVVRTVLEGQNPEPRPGRARYLVVRLALSLLTYPDADPELRDALVGVVATSPGATSIPDFKDPMGRSGIALRIPIAFDAEWEIRVLLDTGGTELLYWSFGPVGGKVEESHLIECTRLVRQIRERPDCDAPAASSSTPGAST